MTDFAAITIALIGLGGVLITATAPITAAVIASRAKTRDHTSPASPPANTPIPELDFRGKVGAWCLVLAASAFFWPISNFFVSGFIDKIEWTSGVIFVGFAFLVAGLRMFYLSAKSEARKRLS